MWKLNHKNSGILTFMGHIGALITVAAWGGSFICSKVLMQEGGLTPVETYTYRFALAYIILLIVTCRKKLMADNMKHELLFLLCGMTSGSIYFILENYALKYSTTANVSMLGSLSPMITTFLVAMLYRTKIASGVIVGSIIAFIGVVCIIFSHGVGFEIHPIGDLLALGGAFSWAIYTIIVKRLSPFYNTFFITRKMFFYGVLTALPLLLLQHEPLHLSTLFDFKQPHFFMNFMFLTVFCSLAAYLLWNETMKILGPVAANNYLYIQPVFTMIIGYIALGEKIFLLGYIGCILIIGGLVLADKWEIVPRLLKRRKSSSGS